MSESSALFLLILFNLHSLAVSVIVADMVLDIKFFDHQLSDKHFQIAYAKPSHIVDSSQTGAV
jgi:hypothetical protein